MYRKVNMYTLDDLIGWRVKEMVKKKNTLPYGEILFKEIVRLRTSISMSLMYDVYVG